MDELLAKQGQCIDQMRVHFLLDISRKSNMHNGTFYKWLANILPLRLSSLKHSQENRLVFSGNYPAEYSRLSTIYICDGCFAYFSHEPSQLRHMVMFPGSEGWRWSMHLQDHALPFCVILQRHLLTFEGNKQSKWYQTDYSLPNQQGQRTSLDCQRCRMISMAYRSLIPLMICGGIVLGCKEVLSVCARS